MCLRGRVAMRVLHVITGLGPKLGGPSKAALEMCQALSAKGVSVSMFTTTLAERGGLLPFRPPATLDVLPNVIDSAGVEIRYFPVAWPYRFGFSIELARALRRELRNFDVVHIHSLFLFPTAIAAHYARRCGVPYIIRPHGTLDPYLRRRHRLRKWIYMHLIELRNLRAASAIHYTSDEEFALVRPLGISNRPAIVPLGVLAAEFTHLPRDRFRAIYPELREKQLVVYLGRLTSKKGLDLLIAAFKTVLQWHPNAHLVIAGPGEDGFERSVERWVQASKLEKHVTLPGMLLGDAKRALLGDTDVWVLPSFSENFGLAAAEALAAGLPVVLTDRVNIHAEISAARAALVVRCRADEIASAISRVLADLPTANQMGLRGQQLVAQLYSWDRVAEQLVDLYLRVQRPSQPHDSGVWSAAGSPPNATGMQ